MQTILQILPNNVDMTLLLAWETIFSKISMLHNWFSQLDHCSAEVGTNFGLYIPVLKRLNKG